MNSLVPKKRVIGCLSSSALCSQPCKKQRKNQSQHQFVNGYLPANDGHNKINHSKSLPIETTTTMKVHDEVDIMNMNPSFTFSSEEVSWLFEALDSDNTNNNNNNNNDNNNNVREDNSMIMMMQNQKDEISTDKNHFESQCIGLFEREADSLKVSIPIPLTNSFPIVSDSQSFITSVNDDHLENNPTGDIDSIVCHENLSEMKSKYQRKELIVLEGEKDSNGAMFKNLLPSKKKQQVSNWCIEEDNVIFELHHKYGNNWAFMASRLPGRTRIDVKTRFRSLCRAAKRFWTNEQDQLLLNLYHTHQNTWNDNILAWFPSRTKGCVKKRLRYLIEFDTNRNQQNKYFPPGSPSYLLAMRPDVVNELLKTSGSCYSIGSLTDASVTDEDVTANESYSSVSYFTDSRDFAKNNKKTPSV